MRTQLFGRSGLPSGRMVILSGVVAAAAALAFPAFADENPTNCSLHNMFHPIPLMGEGEPSADPDADTVFNHPDNVPWWISGSFNFVEQYSPGFPAKYSGTNSFINTPQQRSSRLSDIYLGYKVLPCTEVFFNVEEFNGGGLSNALGMAGYVNLDEVRNPTLGPEPYIARYGIHQIIPLSDNMVAVDRGPFNLSSELPEERIELRAGRFSAADFFDTNAVLSDSHRGFLNWSIDNDGAYDYPADTRGFTEGFMIEYQSKYFGARFLEAEMPYVPNGLQLDSKLSRAHSETVEFEYRPHVLEGRNGTVRVLGFNNHAAMGNYQEAINLYKQGVTPVPDLTKTARNGRDKFGFAISADQELDDYFSVGMRLSWNQGSNENFVYTEVNQAVAVGVNAKGTLWGRDQDKAGIAFVNNQLSKEHAEYLALGGLGFLLGDGKLNYAPERIVEAYYTAHIAPGVSAGPDFQFVQNPGYNKDRGPAEVFGFRVHVDF